MVIPISYILISFLVSMLWAPLLISFLFKFGILRSDKEDFSSVVGERYLKAGTPIMGGLLIIVTTVLLTLFLNFNEYTLIPILLFLLAAIVGGLDDILNIKGKKRTVKTVSKQLKLAKVHKDPIQRLKNLITLPWSVYMNIWYALGSYPGSGIHAGEKIIAELVIGGIGAYWIYSVLGMSTIWIPGLGVIDLLWLMPIFVIFTIISMTNAVNISDGMDGLSSGMLIPIYLLFCIIAVMDGNTAVAILTATVTGSLVAYLYFNIKPARFQMGDVGTLALGTLLGVIAFQLDKVALLPIAGFMFMIEIGSSLVQGIYRKVFGRRLLKMAPLHLHFQIKGWSEEKVVMRFWLFSWVAALFGLWIVTITS